ncbi:MAG: hypothetical protein NUW01_09405 [Gemmatimonadaceae bacterium]|nr:hypothetical protein [Gemmatimonadaceae bacterium]
MNDMPDGNQRVSVSLEILRTEVRAANAELEIHVRDYLDQQVSALRDDLDGLEVEREKRLDERSESAKSAVQVALAAQKEAVMVALSERDKAIEKAERAARETMQSHNDLIRQSRDRDATYATQTDLGHTVDQIGKLESFQSKILGAFALATFVMPALTAVIAFVIARN